MKKLVSGIMSLSIASGMILNSSFIFNSPAQVSAENYTYKAADLVAAISNVVRAVPLSDEQKLKLDINKDTKINVVDIIYLKAILLEDMEPEQENTSTAKLNEYANKIYDDTTSVLSLFETAGEVVEDKIYTSDDDDDLVSEIKEKICLPQNIKWAVTVKDYLITAVICTDSTQKRTGAYPDAIPQSMNVPYDTDYLSYAADINFKWKEKFSSFISEDAVQAALPDYPDFCTTQLNTYAKGILNDIESAITSLDAEGIPLPTENLTSYAEKYNDTEKKILSGIYYVPGLKWIATFKDGHVAGIACTDTSGKHTGTFPNTIPQSLNIPYEEKMAQTASDLDFDWKKEFSDCISSDPVQAALPDYPELSVYTLNSYAKSTFNLTTSILAVQYKDIPIENGIYTYDDDCLLTSEIKSYDSSYYRCKWALIIIDNNVQGVIYSDYTGNRTGAFPNSISPKMNIPYDSKLTEYASDKDFDWKKEFSKYISSDPEQSSLSDYLEMTTNDLNDFAASVFKNAQYIANSYETKGTLLENKTYNSDDDTQYIKDLKSEFYPFDNINFDIVIKDYTVQGVICTDNDRKYTGAFPNIVPQNLNIPYNSDYSSYSYDQSFNWKSKFAECISSDPYQAALPDYPRLFTFDLQQNARKIYNAAASANTTFECYGREVEDKTYSSDDTDKFVSAIKELYIASPNIKWSVTIKDGYVTESACYGTNSHRIGKFPVKK